MALSVDWARAGGAAARPMQLIVPKDTEMWAAV